MSDFIEKKSDFLGEHYYETTHESGLKIAVFPKDFETFFAEVTVGFGSVNAFVGDDGKKLPEGIAHFLEHKMFANADGEDSMEKFARLGGSSNAFTTYNLTTYFFSCHDNFEENLEILLKMVTEPYFTDANVAKEQGIIAQEIKMGYDEPYEMLLLNGMKCMYGVLPVRDDIAGTVESISEITPELLYRCHKAGYSPANMNLTVCGRADKEKVLETVNRIFGKEKAEKVSLPTEREPEAVVSPRAECEMEVSKPLFCVMVKNSDIGETPEERAKENAIYDVLTEMYFGPTSDFVSDLYEQGKIISSSAEMTHLDGFSFFRFCGDCEDPDGIMTLFKEYTARIREEKPDEKEIAAAKRAVLADHVKDFDSTENIAIMLSCDYLIEGTDLFDYKDDLEAVTAEDISSKLNTLFDPERYVLSAVKPNKRS
ncbi:MAG: insulinase family protein [Firmicutes bacterium]|nr:insulinase family protein [Candidatus Colimorpha enterica]